MTTLTPPLGVGLTLGTALLALPSLPATASLSSNTIGATGTLDPHGRTAPATALIDCTAGQSVKVRVTLTQGLATGEGVGGESCTGALAVYQVRVTTQGAFAFTPGPAQACASAVNRDRGRIVDTRQWCRAEPVQLTAHEEES